MINYCVRFQVLTTASIKMTAFWDMTACNPAEVGLRLRGVYGVYHRRDDGGNMHLWNFYFRDSQPVCREISEVCNEIS
jgi:hypothetical protein